MEKKLCPTCKGKKLIVGTCECNSEWRSVEDDDSIDDCICNPDETCPTCSGTGYIQE